MKTLKLGLGADMLTYKALTAMLDLWLAGTLDQGDSAFIVAEANVKAYTIDKVCQYLTDKGVRIEETVRL